MIVDFAGSVKSTDRPGLDVLVTEYNGLRGLLTAARMTQDGRWTSNFEWGNFMRVGEHILSASQGEQVMNLGTLVTIKVPSALSGHYSDGRCGWADDRPNVGRGGS